MTGNRMHPLVCLMLFNSFASLASASQTETAKHHALLIGNQHYSRAKVSPNSWRDHIEDLDGPANDVAAMQDILILYFNFEKSDIDCKIDQGRAQMLSEMDDLARASGRGDIVLLYYSGHGGAIKNSKTAKHSYHPLDGSPAYGVSNTIVPADSLDGAEDITDKQLARKLDAILDKIGPKGRLTAIFDSCYSGTITRGITMKNWKTRAAPEPHLDALGKPIDRPDEIPDDQVPWKRGAVTISACRFNEPAVENGEMRRGAFSNALTETLNQERGGISLDRLVDEVGAKVQSYGVDQVPVYECRDGMEKLGLMGGDVTPGRDPRLFYKGKIGVSEPDFGDHPNGIKLQGGLDLGIHKGAVLEGGGIQLTVYAEPNISESHAEITKGSRVAFDPSKGFHVVSWMAGSFPGVKLLIPRAPMKVVELVKLGSDLSKAETGGRMADDPTVQAASIQCSYGRQGWILQETGKAETQLGRELDVAALQGGHGTLFVNYPLASDVNLRLPEGGMLEEAAPGEKCDYALVGRVRDGHLEYAWVRPGAGKGAQSELAPDPDEKSAHVSDAMPPRTGWIPSDPPDACAQLLLKDAEKLSNLRNWLNLKPQDDGGFPYHLELWESETKKVVPENGLVLGYEGTETNPSKRPKDYQLMLVPNADIKKGDQANFQTRYVYVCDIDNSFKGSRIYPDDNEDGEPIVADANDKAKLLGTEFGFNGKMGTEHFILITSKDKLPKDLFMFEGFEEAKRGTGSDETALGRLLAQASSGTRSTTQSTPPTWSVQYLVVTSKLANQK